MFALLQSLFVLLLLRTASSFAQQHSIGGRKVSISSFAEAGLASSLRGSGRIWAPERHLLAAPSTQLQQNVSFVNYGTFREQFVYYANRTLSAYDLPHLDTNCSIIPGLNPAVATCSGTNQVCCLDASNVQDQSTLPNTLATICNNIALNGSVCQGFTFDSATNLAVFKGQAALEAVDILAASQASDTTDLWWLDAANAANQSVDHRPSVMAAAPQYKQYFTAIANCQNVGTYAADPATGRSLVQGPQYPAQNVTTTNPPTSYSFYAYTDLAQGDGLLPNNGTCNTNPNITQYTAALNSCGNANSGCCIDMSSYTGSELLEQYLADVCNSIIINGSVCQAFDYNTVSKVAFFKGQPPTMQIDYSTAACIFPNVTLWVLSSAEPGSGKSDTRPVALAALAASAGPSAPAPPSSGNNNNSNVGSALGTALGVATPCLGVAIWLAVTYTYRQEKRRLVAQVESHLTPDMVAENDPLGTKYPPIAFRSLDRDDSATNFIIPAQRTAVPTAAMLKVAKEMTHRCLRRWDAILALRASKDSQGKGQGIWRDRYEGVRGSVMLLALNNLNKDLQATQVVPYDGNPVHSGCLLTAWLQANHSQKRHLLNLLVRKVHDISEEEAQALPDKDVDTNSFYDKVVSWLNSKLTRS